MDKHNARLQKLFATSVNTQLQDEHDFSLKQSEAIVSAAGPGRAIKCVEWLATLLREHPPGIVGLVLTTSLTSIDNYGDSVRVTLKELYGMQLPGEAYTFVAMRAFLAGALQVLVAKAQRGDFGNHTQSVFNPPTAAYVYDPQSDTMDSTLPNWDGSKRSKKGGGKR